MPFALTSNPNLNEISDAINYLLSNFGSNVSIDLQTGIIAGPSGRISNLYKYIQIKYATSYDGSVGFSNVPTNATYYGIRNSNDSTESTNPADYIWYKTTGFGTTNYLYYIVAGGRQIDFFLSPTAPSDYYVKDPGTAIDIDIVTTTSTQNVSIPAIYQWTSGSAPSRPSTTSTYTWATASYSAPSGWSTTPTSNTTAGYVQWAIFVPITANSNTATSVIDWTNTGYPIVQFSSNGATGTTGGSGLSSLTAYLQQSQSSSPPSTPANTTGATAPTGWSLTAPTSVTVGNVVWYTFGQYNSSSATISGIPAGQTQWGVPTAASIFQDIRSDNWNGSTPPTYGTPGTYGTNGYYIQRSTGNCYFNNAVFRGEITGGSNISITGNAIFAGSYSSGGYSNAIVANYTYAANVGVLSFASGTAAFLAQASGTANGVYSYSTSSQASVYAYSSGSGAGLSVGSGVMTISNNTLVSNLYAQYAQSMVGTSANQLRFVSGTSTGSGVATFASTNKPGSTTTNVWMTVQIDATTLYIPVWT